MKDIDPIAVIMTAISTLFILLIFSSRYQSKQETDMKKEIMVVMLPTKDATNGCILKYRCDNLEYKSPAHGFTQEYLKSIEAKSYHSYVTVSQEIEPIKEGDWILYDVSGYKSSFNGAKWALGKVNDISEVGKANAHYGIDYYDGDPFYETPQKVAWHADECLKIIVTTDKKLTGVSQLQQSFVEEYCKRGGVGKVMAEYYSDCVCHLEGDNHRVVPITGTTCMHCGESILEKLKLNQDNTINISFIEEKMYSEAFVLWYSGMELEKIRLAHKRWLKEKN